MRKKTFRHIFGYEFNYFFVVGANGRAGNVILHAGEGSATSGNDGGHLDLQAGSSLYSGGGAVRIEAGSSVANGMKGADVMLDLMALQNRRTNFQYHFLKCFCVFRRRHYSPCGGFC